MTVSTDAIAPVRHGPTREDRAAKGFLTLALFSVLVLIVAGSDATGFTPLERATGLAPAIVSIVALVVALYGVAARRSWALAIVDPILWILVVEGIAISIRALAHSSLQIPIGTVLALWVLRAPREPVALQSGQPRASIASFALVGLFLVGAIGPFVGSAFLQAGGFLNRQGDLDATLSLDCGTQEGAPPATIRVRYAWSWLRREAFASGTDQIVIEWVDQADGGVTGYTLAGTQLPARGVIEANREIGSPPAIVFGGDLAANQTQSNEVGLVLQRTISDGQTSGRVEVLVRYMHGPVSVDDRFSSGIWATKSDQSCSW
jgi:hypothetical protein